jgi:starvation-inducible outer membrane lipoprotein
VTVAILAIACALLSGCITVFPPLPSEKSATQIFRDGAVTHQPTVARRNG